MKELTHCTFSVGASIFVLCVLDLLSWPSILVALWLSFAVNCAIDVFGHTWFGPPSRTRLTHSLFTAPLWGVVVSYASYALVAQIFPVESVLVLWYWIVGGIAIAMGHLFLDSFTQAGIFYWRRRIAIAHFRYDNPVVNAGFILIGLGLLAMALGGLEFIARITPIALSFFVMGAMVEA